jgi:hypothetical protein
VVESPLDRDPHYQSADWLNLSGEHRVSLGLRFDPNCDDTEPCQTRRRGYDMAIKKQRGARGKPFKLIFTNGAEDFQNRNEAARRLGISGKTLETWCRIGPPSRYQTSAWPDSLMCFRYL